MTRTFDVWMVRALREPNDPAHPLGPGWLPEVAIDITALGGGSLLTLFCGVAAGFLCLHRKLRSAAFFLASVVGGTVLDYSLKALYARPRPTVVPRLTAYDASSFPSGHSMLSAVTYLTIGVVLTQFTPGCGSKRYLLTVAMLLTAAVGLSRIYLGVHYPTDVLAGWIAGTTWTVLCSLVNPSIPWTRTSDASTTDGPFDEGS